jgi:hypothetical protein
MPNARPRPVGHSGMDHKELRPAGWDPLPADDADDEFDEPDRRVGQLVALPDDDDASDEAGEWQDVLAEEEFRTPGDRCAEEAAMHIVRDGHGGLTGDDPYGSGWDERG